MTEFTVEEENGVTVVKFDGALTSVEVLRLEPQFQKATRRPDQRVVVDLSKVTMVATPAIAMFIGALKAQRELGGRVIFTGTQGAIDKILHTCRLDMIMTIVPDPKAAVTQAAR